jgi:hypothetical protein
MREPGRNARFPEPQRVGVAAPRRFRSVARRDLKARRTRLFARREQRVERRRLQLDARVADQRYRRFDLRLKSRALFFAAKHATRRHAHALNRDEHRAVLREQTALDDVVRGTQLFGLRAATFKRAAERGVKRRRSEVVCWRRSDIVGVRVSRGAVVC